MMSRSKFHSLFFYASSITLIFASVFFIQAYLGVTKTHAGPSPSSPTLYGYGWSETIGWISFNGPVKSGGTYSVNIDGSGNMTGYGWSENVGWVKFGGLSGFPSGTGTTASNANYNGTTMTGWIRVCGGQDDGTPNPPGTNNTCSGVSRPDGWDGWISLKGITDKGGSYGVTATQDPIDPNRKNLSGFLWGSDVVGWIDMSNAYILSSTPTSVSISAAADPLGCFVNVTWNTVPTPAPDGTTFSIKSNGNYIEQHLDLLPPYSYLDQNTAPNGYYSYVVEAYDKTDNLIGSGTTNQAHVDPNCQGISAPPIIGSFIAVPAVVPLNTQCSLQWTGIQNVDVTKFGQSCIITGPGVGSEFPYTLSTTTNGSHPSTKINATSRYTITCNNGVGSISKTTTCSLKPAYNEF